MKTEKPLIAIACGGTGGHLFPGLTIGREFVRRGCDVTLLVSPKEVDQIAVRCVTDMDVVTLPSVALQGRNYLKFIRSLRSSVREARRLFKHRRPAAVFSMGGFTAAAPVMAGKLSRAKLFLHESNAIPGRANRYLAPWVNRAFVGFREAVANLKAREVTISGTPVREQFQSVVVPTCRRVLGLAEDRRTLLIMGGSQGATAINELLMKSMPLLRKRLPVWQYCWLTGANDAERVRDYCRESKVPAVVRRFLPEMELAYGSATVTIGRSGAASLAESAAMKVPSILVPLPSSADNHQQHNALNFERTGAARLLEQKTASPEQLVDWVAELGSDDAARTLMSDALGHWHREDAAELICSRVLHAIGHGVSAGDVSDIENDEASLTERGSTLRLVAS